MPYFLKILLFPLVGKIVISSYISVLFYRQIKRAHHIFKLLSYSWTQNTILQFLFYICRRIFLFQEITSLIQGVIKSRKEWRMVRRITCKSKLQMLKYYAYILFYNLKVIVKSKMFIILAWEAHICIYDAETRWIWCC